MPGPVAGAECRDVLFRTSPTFQAASTGPFFVGGYQQATIGPSFAGSIPLECHDSPGSECTLRICAPRFEVASGTADGWFVEASVDGTVAFEGWTKDTHAADCFEGCSDDSDPPDINRRHTRPWP